MKSRKVTIRVICDLPRGMNVNEFEDYVRDAVQTMGGCYDPDCFFFDPDFRRTIITKRSYERERL